MTGFAGASNAGLGRGRPLARPANLQGAIVHDFVLFTIFSLRYYGNGALNPYWSFLNFKVVPFRRNRSAIQPIKSKTSGTPIPTTRNSVSWRSPARHPPNIKFKAIKPRSLATQPSHHKNVKPHHTQKSLRCGF